MIFAIGLDEFLSWLVQDIGIDFDWGFRPLGRKNVATRNFFSLSFSDFLIIFVAIYLVFRAFFQESDLAFIFGNPIN